MAGVELGGLIPPLENIAEAWLADAELSFSLVDRRKAGLSLFFPFTGELRAFLSKRSEGDAVWREEERVRTRFDLAPRHWVKIHYKDEVPVVASQYFQVDPRLEYPIATIRAFVRMYGGDPAGLEELFVPELEDRDTIWGLVLKHRDGGMVSRVTCSTRFARLDDLLARLKAQGHLSTSQFKEYSEGHPVVGDDERIYFTLSPGVQGKTALDIASVPAERSAFSGAVPHDTKFSYIKMRASGSGAPVDWTGYLPLETVRSWTGPSEDVAVRRTAARKYYDAMTPSILESMGSTYQAGLVVSRENETPTPSSSNRELAARAGITGGERVIDLGCGAGGPAADMAEAFSGLQVQGVTISRAQAAAAKKLFRDRGLQNRVCAAVGDFHQLPFPSQSFDVAVVFEAVGYAFDLDAWCSEVARVLDDNGRLYVKDVFVADIELSPEVRARLAEFDRIYRQKTPTVSMLTEALSGAGFEINALESLSDRISMEHFHEAMRCNGSQETDTVFTEFGRHHFRSFPDVPFLYADVLAVKQDK